MTEDDWQSNPEVDWQADQSGVLDLTVSVESEHLHYRAADLEDVQAHIHISDSKVNLFTDNEGEDTGDDPQARAGLTLSPEEAQRLGRQLIFAGENAEEREVADVRT